MAQLPIDSANDSAAAARHNMVETQIRKRGITDPAVLLAMKTVPRHEFVPERFRDVAYDDGPIPLLGDIPSTISQPYMVALMSAYLDFESGMTIFEVGTGSGYQAAILAEMGGRIVTAEVRPELIEPAMERLKRLGYADRVRVLLTDGSEGVIEEAPFDRIIVTAAIPKTPEALLRQLKPGGIMLVPLGKKMPHVLTRITKSESGAIKKKSICSCRFVPMVKAP